MPDMEENLSKMRNIQVGMSLRMKILLFLMLIVITAVVYLVAISVLEEKGSFLEQCSWTEEYLRYSGDVKDEKSALAVLADYTNISQLTHDPQILDYKCYGQYYFYSTKTSEQYYVCRSGIILKITPYNCSFSYDMDYLPQVTRTLGENK
jgi:hypothetical protein